MIQDEDAKMWRLSGGGLSLHVFRNIFGRFFLFLAEQGGCWVGVAGRGCHDVEAEREAFFSPVFLDGFDVSSNPTSTCFRISD